MDNIINNIIPDGSGSDTPPSPEIIDTTIMPDLDTMFGDPVEDQLGLDGNKQPGSNQSSTPEPGKFPADQPTDIEKLLRKLQSEGDKAKSELQKVKEQLRQKEQLTKFLEEIQFDEELKQAFISQLAPDLVKPKDLKVLVSEKLKAEFGEDFTPEPSEAAIFGSPTYNYNERARELVAEFKSKYEKIPKDLETLKAKRMQAREEAKQKAEAEKRELINDFKWSETTFDTFVKWVNSVELKDMGKIFNSAIRSTRRNTPPSLTTFGGQTPADNNYFAHLDAMYGK